MDMVCITVASRRVDDRRIVASSRKVDEPLTASSRKVDEPLTASSQRVDKPLVAHSRVVCIISSGYYLRIEPQTVWLVESNDYSADVDVYSNVDWIIE